MTRTRTRRRARGKPAVPPLARALAYRNDQIVYKFMERWDVSFADAEDLFDECKKLLWLMQRAGSRGHRFIIDDPLRMLDEMWHTFVLFTREYTDYCERLYGMYVHHAPTTRREKDALAQRMRQDRAGFLRELTARQDLQWELVAAELGQDTVLKWYVEIPLRYPTRFFRTGQKALEMSWKPPPSLARLVNPKKPARRRAVPLRA